jgi:hypothetical protein
MGASTASVAGILGAARPRVRIGAEAPGGLALPPAQAGPDCLYAPRGVYFDDRRLIVTDTGNHRILIFDGVPDVDGASASVVLGQPDMHTEGPQAGGRGPENGLHLPTGILVLDGRLFIADAWNHRVLAWDAVPEASGTPPDLVLGQRSLADVEANQGGGAGPTTFYWPFGLGWIHDVFYVADTGNRRVLAWEGVPEPGQEPDLILGQPDAGSRDENRSGVVGPDSFRWPHDIAGTSDRLWIADAGNHRLLGWTPAPKSDGPADTVLGQPDFATAREWPYGSQSATALRFPYAASDSGGRLAVADTANNRILIWEDHEELAPTGAPAVSVLGQPDFEANGENRWEKVADDTLCWPYGIHLRGDTLAVADSGNNRVMIWELT